MRKSRTVSTLILAGAAVALAGCDAGTEEAKLYSSVDTCKTEMAAEQCEQEWKAAQEEHLRTAPQFADKAQCEQEFGAESCQQVEQKTAEGQATGSQATGSSAGSFFMPLMMGYMMGNMMSGGARPVYVDRQGYARSGGATVAKFPDAAAAKPGSSWRTTAAVDRSVLRNPAPAAGVIAPGARSYGGFGSTGSRAAMSGGA